MARPEPGEILFVVNSMEPRNGARRGSAQACHGKARIRRSCHADRNQTCDVPSRCGGALSSVGRLSLSVVMGNSRQDGPTAQVLHAQVAGDGDLKARGAHFGHFLYGGLHVAKVRQEHFALKRRIRFRCHVVAVVDTLD